MILRSSVICLFLINVEGIRLGFVSVWSNFFVPNFQTETMKVVLPETFRMLEETKALWSRLSANAFTFIINAKRC
jgi:hypothetical protein